MVIRETKRSASSVADEVAAAEANLKAAQERLHAARQRFESAQNINAAQGVQRSSPFDQASFEQSPSAAPQNYGCPMHKPQTDHIAAGILAIVFGALGIHKFYMGKTNVGFIVLGITVIGSFLTFGAAGLVMQLIGMVEGVMYLVKTQESFEDEYLRGARSWF